jgi:signal transduction histidine kinase
VSLRRQFLLVFVAFSVVISGVGGVLAYRNTSRVLERQLDDKLVQIALTAVEVGLVGSADELLSLLPGEERSPTFTAVQQRLLRLRRVVDEAFVFRPDLTAVVTTRPADSLPIGSYLGELAPYGPEIGEAMRAGQATSPLLGDGDPRYYKYAFVNLGGEPIFLAVLGTADYMEPLVDFQRTVIVGSLLSMVLAALLAWALATTVTRPLERLGRVALRIQRGRMNEAVKEERGGELRRLSQAMERMREGILHRDEQLRLMLAQVAHEIRNPLGGLELFASAAVETLDPAERTQLLAKVRSEVVALNEIIDDFLTFARPIKPEGRFHDVRSPLREAVELVEMEMRGSGRRFTVELPEEALLAKADPEHVKRVVLNLLRNAAQAGVNVGVRGETVRGEVVITVVDDGPGIPSAMRDRIFEPFVTDKEQGAGLGLAIVKSVVEGSQGRVEVHNIQDMDPEAAGGAEFRVYFRGAEDIPGP